MELCGIHLKTVLHEVLKVSFHHDQMTSKITLTFLELQPQPLGGQWVNLYCLVELIYVAIVLLDILEPELMADMLQTKFSLALFQKKFFMFDKKFHEKLSVVLRISQQCFRK